MRIVFLLLGCLHVQCAAIVGNGIGCVVSTQATAAAATLCSTLPWATPCTTIGTHGTVRSDCNARGCLREGNAAGGGGSSSSGHSR